MAQQDLLDAYQNMALLMQKMHIAAETEDWDQVFEIELLYAENFEQVKQLEAANRGELSESFKAKKIEIIQAILAEEQTVKDLVAPQMLALEKKANSAQTQVKLNNTYVS